MDIKLFRAIIHISFKDPCFILSWIWTTSTYRYIWFATSVVNENFETFLNKLCYFIWENMGKKNCCYCTTNCFSFHHQSSREMKLLADGKSRFRGFWKNNTENKIIPITDEINIFINVTTTTHTSRGLV